MIKVTQHTERIPVLSLTKMLPRNIVVNGLKITNNGIYVVRKGTTSHRHRC